MIEIWCRLSFSKIILVGKSHNARCHKRLKSRQYWDKRWEEVMRAEPIRRKIIKSCSALFDKLKRAKNFLMKYKLSTGRRVLGFI
jgi:hypothetical protein